jgi:hypothetical protein
MTTSLPYPKDAWLAQLAEDVGRTLAKSRVRPELACLLLLALLANPQTGLVLVPRQRLARLAGMAELVLDAVLKSLEAKRLIHAVEPGMYLVISLRTWHNGQSNQVSPNAAGGASGVEISTPHTKQPARSALQNRKTAERKTASAEQDPSDAGQPGEGVNRPGSGEEDLERFVCRLVTAIGAPARETASYETFCRRYPRQVLETALERVKRTPAERIRKSRGALFTYLVKTLAGGERSE